jgi:hypothetical protein
VRTAKIERVHEGVYAAIAEEDGVAVGNAGFVDLGGETLVFDTHVSLAAARELRAAAERFGPVRTAELMRERTGPRIEAMKARPLEDFDGTPFAEIARSEHRPR